MSNCHTADLENSHAGLTTLVLCLVAVFLASVAVADDLPEKLAGIRSGLVEKIDSGELPSISIMVYSKGEAVWQEALGWADRDNKKPATLETVYGLGSMSKSITGTGLMVLVDRGLVDLNAPVDTYLGEQKLTMCVDVEEPVTVRDLLLCSAGIPHGWLGYVLGDEPDFAGGDEYIRRFGLVAFPPGELFLYSNHAYGIAREIIANASGRTYEEFMREEVFEPLGMKSSGLGIARTADDVALPYYENTALQKGLVTGPVGGATLFSSAKDIMRYTRYHLGRPFPDQRAIFSEETMRLSHSIPEDRLPGSWMTLGWAGIELGDIGTVMISNGEVTGANATALLIPKSDLAVVCLANKAFSPSISDGTAFGIADALVPGFMGEFEKMGAEYEATYYGQYQVADELLGSWAGEITSAEGITPLTLQFQQDRDIHVRVGVELKTLLSNTMTEYGLIKGSCSGNLSVSDDFRPGTLSFYLSSSEESITGYVQWITMRTDAAGDDWSIVIPGCLSLIRQEESD